MPYTLACVVPSKSGRTTYDILVLSNVGLESTTSGSNILPIGSVEMLDLASSNDSQYFASTGSNGLVHYQDGESSSPYQMMMPYNGFVGFFKAL